MNFKVINPLGDIVGFVLNVKDESTAQQSAKELIEDYFDVRDINANPKVPFQCVTDVKSGLNLLNMPI